MNDLHADLHSVARRNRVNELRRAIAEGARLDDFDAGGATPLHEAVAGRATESAIALIDAGASVRLTNEDGQTALHGAVEHGLLEIAAAIVQKDPSVISIPDGRGNTPFWTAAIHAHGRYDLVELLLANGANPDHRNHAGLTPSEVPKRIGDPVLLELMERYGSRAER